MELPFHLIFVILRRAAEFQLSEGVLLAAAGGRFSYHFVNWGCEYLPFLQPIHELPQAITIIISEMYHFL